MRRILAIFIVAAALLAANVASPAFAAAGPVHQYFYNTAGIVHGAGNAANYDLSYDGVVYPARTVWEEGQGFDPSLSMWYGPKPTISGLGDTYQMCWDYVAPAGIAATVVFDITFSANPTDVLWSSGNKTIDPVAPGDQWPLQVFCHSLTLNGTWYSKFQIRARVVSVGVAEYNTFKLYKTTYQDIGTIV